MKKEIPNPQLNERPTSYADRLGRWYSTIISADHKKCHGQYLTSEPVAHYMASLFQPGGDLMRVLDPGAGSGILTCAVAEHLVSRQRKPSRLEVAVYENDPELAEVLRKSLAYLKEWLSERDIVFEAEVSTDDFVLTHSEVMCDALGKSPRLFRAGQCSRNFDLAISNPPYFKIPKSDPRAKAASAVIHGQPNIYALFMAVSASILKPGGQFVFITPRSYASGPYFRLFRERFFAKMRPELVHVFESRTDAFKRDDILQENIILKARREDGWAETTKHNYIWISSSNGSGDFGESKRQKIQSDLILDMSRFDKVLYVPTTDEQLDVMQTVRSWSGSLRKLGLEISTGPVVPFRAVSLLDEEGEVPGSHAPLMWMQHVKAMTVQWPIATNRKPQFIKVTGAAMKLLVPNKNYVLMRRFSAKEEKRRLVAAPYLKDQSESQWLGLENHLNYIHRPGGELTEEEARGLSVLYNSSVMDTYFRSLNGNTQVSATELRAMPLPDRDLLVRIGTAANPPPKSLEEIDILVASILHESLGSSGEDQDINVRGYSEEALQEAASGG
jgi:adenine-specific DNA-methyltransferase